MATGRVLALAAAVLAIAGCTDSVDSRSDVTNSSAAVEPATVTTLRPIVDPWLGARVAPNVVAAGDWFEVTPGQPIDPTCGVTMRFYTPVAWGQGEPIGALLMNGEWLEHEPGATTTLPPCLPPPVSDPVGASVPNELAAALHEACIDDVTEGWGCGLLRIVRPGEIAAEAAEATAEPAIVAPADRFVVVPAGEGALVCSRHELFVGVGGELDLVGFPTPSGSIGLPVPGATTTVPRCGDVNGVPTEPITFVTPDVPDGEYLLCLAYRHQRNSCARIEVEA